MNSSTHKTSRGILVIGTLIVVLLLVNVGVTIYFGKSTSPQQQSTSYTRSTQNPIESINFQFGSRNEANTVPQSLLDGQQMSEFMITGFYSMASYGATNAHLERSDLVIDPKKPLSIALSSEGSTNMSLCEQGKQKCRVITTHKFSKRPVAVVLKLSQNQLAAEIEETYGSLQEGVYESDSVIVRFD